MSFLKQLLNPFIEFDADKKQAPPEPAQPPPTTQPQEQKPLPPTPAQALNEAAVHPLITGELKSQSNPAEQLPIYSPSGTLVAPLPQHVASFEYPIA